MYIYIYIYINTHIAFSRGNSNIYLRDSTVYTKSIALSIFKF